MNNIEIQFKMKMNNRNAFKMKMNNRNSFSFTNMEIILKMKYDNRKYSHYPVFTIQIQI